jgi:hypothetical protein
MTTDESIAILERLLQTKQEDNGMKITLENEHGTYSAEETLDTWMDAMSMFAGVLRCAGYVTDVDIGEIIDTIRDENVMKTLDHEC